MKGLSPAWSGNCPERVLLVIVLGGHAKRLQEVGDVGNVHSHLHSVPGASGRKYQS